MLRKMLILYIGYIQSFRKLFFEQTKRSKKISFLKVYITYNRLTVSPASSNRVHYVNRRSPLNRLILHINFIHTVELHHCMVNISAKFKQNGAI
jgi:hypothetical protein